MTAVSATGAAAFLGRFEGLRTRLPGARLPWVEAMRDAASVAFRQAGFPTRRVGKPEARKDAAAPSRSASTQATRAPGRRVRSPS
jgi:hypothetical protein